MLQAYKGPKNYIPSHAPTHRAEPNTRRPTSHPNPNGGYEPQPNSLYHVPADDRQNAALQTNQRRGRVPTNSCPMSQHSRGSCLHEGHSERRVLRVSFTHNRVMGLNQSIRILPKLNVMQNCIKHNCNNCKV